MSVWRKYKELEPMRRLKNEGRELLGKPLYFTEKRDGENVSLWINDEGAVSISSHNMEKANDDIVSRMKATPEYGKAVQLLEDELNFNKHYIVYGELMKTVGATRIEPRRKHCHWILFDIYDLDETKYVYYTMLYQKAFHHHIPIVKALDLVLSESMEELQEKIDQWLKWCRIHRREGIVIKCYENQEMCKEKIDLPKLPKIKTVNPNQIVYPPMPQERIIRALQHAFDEVGEENWKTVKIAMPVVAKHFEVEAKEHNFNTPRNMYQIYLETPVSLIKGNLETESL